MKALFTSMLQALAQGEGVVLCSILASSGSTPVSYTHLTLPTTSRV